MRKIKVSQNVVVQLEDIKDTNYEYVTDEVYAVISGIPDDYTAGYVQAVIEGYTDSLSGNELVEEAISFIELLISVHGEEVESC